MTTRQNNLSDIIRLLSDESLREFAAGSGRRAIYAKIELEKRDREVGLA
jgi:hypothetical protein